MNASIKYFGTLLCMTMTLVGVKATAGSDLNSLGQDILIHNATIKTWAKSSNDLHPAINEVFFDSGAGENDEMKPVAYCEDKVLSESGTKKKLENICDKVGFYQNSGFSAYSMHLMGSHVSNVASGGGYFSPPFSPLSSVSVKKKRNLRIYNAKMEYGKFGTKLNVKIKFDKNVGYLCGVRAFSINGGKSIGYDTCDIEN